MRLLSYGLWMIAGIGLAFIFLKSQSWSVKFIHPEHVKLSKWLVVGGAFLRWALAFLVFLFALADSLMALLVVFCTFMLSRLIILLTWQGIIQFKSIRINKYGMRD